MKPCVCALNSLSLARSASLQVRGNYRTGSSTITGRRAKRQNEDRFVVKRLTSNVQLCAVLDGHNGSFVSEYLRRNLPDVINKRLLSNSESFEKDQQEADENYANVFVKFEMALLGAFDECQYLVTKALHQTNGYKRRDIVGSTAVVALLQDRKFLTVANIGDSNAIACVRGLPVQLTVNHNPENEAEAIRIEAAGGWIDWDNRFKPMINGRLSVSRSFGNLSMRPYGIISKPFIRHRLVEESDSFVALLSDGVSHTITDKEIVSIITHHDNPVDACEDLTSTAQQYGSEDDVTAIVVPLAGWGTSTLWNVEQGNYSIFRTMVGNRSGG